MTAMFDVQGFGVLSLWNGQLQSAAAQQAMQSIAAAGSNSIEIATRLWTSTGTSNTVFADSSKTESDASLAAGIQYAHSLGLTVVLKPTITALDSTYAHNLAPTDVAAFFASYKDQIVHLATVAQQNGVEMLSLGNEMSNLTGSQYRSYWLDIIAAVRQVYSGEITYSAATSEASTVSFWDQVDVIGVNVYPPLTSSTTPTVEDLVNAWTQVPADPFIAASYNNMSPVDFLHSLALQYDKQVLFTEVGYRSIDGTAINPGDWQSTGTSNLQAQYDAYNAFYQVWSAYGGSWLKGYEVWNWDLTNAYAATGYSPMGKPALNLITQWMQGTAAATDLNLTGSTVADVIDLGAGNNTIFGGLGNDLIRGNAGNDIIVGGPDTISQLGQTTITITGFGTSANGVNPKLQLWINGKPVGSEATFTSATDPSGYQTYTLVIDNPAVIDSLDISIVNASTGVALKLRSITVNGKDLLTSDAQNFSSPGSFDLYNGYIHFDMSGRQGLFLGGNTDNDTIYGGDGDDSIFGGAGNDYIDGGAGTDTAGFSGNLADYTIGWSNGELVVHDTVSGRDGEDLLVNVENLQFADTLISATSIMASLTPTTTVPETPNDNGGGTGTPTTPVQSFAAEIVGKPYTYQHTAYDAAGDLTTYQYRSDTSLYAKIITNVDGSGTSDYYDTSGNVTQHIDKTADGTTDTINYNVTTGAKTSETIRRPDGSNEFWTYGITGKAYTTTRIVYDASGNQTIYQYTASGVTYLRQVINIDGSGSTDQYDTSGHLIQHIDKLADGTTDTINYNATTGAKTSETIRHPDGSSEFWTYGITGKAYTTTRVVFDATGNQTLYQYTSSNILYFKQVTNTNGSSTTDQYDTSGNLTQHVDKAVDGTTDTINYNVTTGAKTSETIRHPDGSSEFWTYGITGQAYTTTKLVFDATGNQTLYQYTSSNVLYFKQVTNTNGSGSTDQYDTSGRLLQHVDIAADGSTDTSVYDPATGAKTSETIRHPDGSREFWTYGITGQPYVTTRTVFDAAGNQTLYQYTSSNILYFKQVTNTDGSGSTDQYNTSGQLLQHVDTAADRTTDTSVYDPATGAKTSETIRYPDGSREFWTLGITGKPYTTTRSVFDAAGNQTLYQYTATGIYYKQVTNTDGSGSTDQYDTSGHLTQHIDKLADGTTDTINYNVATGTKTTETIRRPDGSSEFWTYGITGQAYTTTKLVFDPTGNQTLYQYTSSNILYFKQVTNTNGSGSTDQYNTSGQLLQHVDIAADGSTDTSVYDPATGAKTSETIRHPDGSREFWTYAITGQPYTSSRTVFDAAGNQTLYQYTSSNILYYKITTNIDSTKSSDQYDSSGHLIQHIDTAADGTTDTSVYDPATGAKTSETIRYPDGSREFWVLGITGKPYTTTRTVFDAAGNQTAYQYTATGIYYKQVTNTDGSGSTDQYDTSGHLLQHVDTAVDGSTDTSVYDPATGAKTSETIRHADGTREFWTYGITGQAYTSTKVAFDAAGNQTLYQYTSSNVLYYRLTTNIDGTKSSDQYDTSGRLVQHVDTAADGTTDTSVYDPATGAKTSETIRHPDGSREFWTYGIAGQPYVTTRTVFDAAGNQTLYQYTSSNVLYYRLTTNTDGTKSSDQYDTSGRLVQHVDTAADGTTDTSVYDPATGTKTSETVRHPDGSREFWTYGITGQAYTSTKLVFDAAGNQTLYQYTSSNVLYYKLTTNIDGTKSSDQYDTSGRLVQHIDTAADGSTDTSVYDPATGAKTSETIRHPDGSREFWTLGITGKPYVTTRTVIDAAGNQTAYQYTATAIYYKQVTNIDGTKSSDQYDISGRLVQHVDTAADGTTDTSVYDPTSGAKTSETIVRPDGSKDINLYGITGKPYTSQHLVYDTAGNLTTYQYRSDSTLYAKLTTNIDRTSSSEYYNTSGILTQRIATAADGTTDTSVYDGTTGAKTSETIVHPDGSKEVDLFGITGKPYTSQRLVYDAAGNLTTYQYRSDSTLYAKLTTNIDRTSSSEYYNTSGILTQRIATAADGTTDTSVYDPTTGSKTSETIVHPDGSKEVDLFGITGKPYTSQHFSYAANGTLTQVNQYVSSGVLYSTQVLNADGTRTFTPYAQGASLSASSVSDTFVIHAGLAQVNIYGFTAGDGTNHDVVQIDSSIASDFSHLNIRTSGSDAFITLNSSDTLILRGLTTALTANDFTFV